MDTLIIETFPNSKKYPFIKTSEQTPIYNCIAWAFGDDTRFYWPSTHPFHYWPVNVPFEESIEAFIKLYESIGYECCTNEDLEQEFEKISIYADDEGEPTHAAKQLPDGNWSSKLGMSYDVTHTIKGMSDSMYGKIVQFMKRKKLII